jgi:hypothetical protein
MTRGALMSRSSKSGTSKKQVQKEPGEVIPHLFGHAWDTRAYGIGLCQRWRAWSYQPATTQPGEGAR